jgi:NAD(P) transhydrogenase
MSAAKYDLIVIGSGPAGQRAAVAASKMGKRVAVIEARQVVGGECINTGTIPSKTMREAVLHLSGYNYRAIYGVNYRVKEKITMADLAFRVQAVIKTEVDVTEAQLSRNGIDVVHGIARFVDPHQMRVGRHDSGSRADRYWGRHQTRRIREGAGEWQDDYQQRPDSGPGGAA